MFTESQNAAIVRTELDYVFYQEFEYDAGPVQPQIATANSGDLFKPQYTTHAYEIFEVYKGVSLYTQTGETQNVPLDTPKVANKATIQVADWTKGIYLSKNLFDDNLHSVWSRTIQDMALKARVTQDNNAFAIFRGATTTTLTADGDALLSTHTLLNGTTYSNLITTGTTGINFISINKLITALRQQPDQAGVILGNVPSILLVPSALFQVALQQTDSALIADNSNNAINVYRSAYGFKVMTSPYLDAVAGGSDTYFFLMARNHSVTRLIRQGIETNLRDWSYSDNRSYFYQANFRESYYVPDYIGIVGATS